MQDETAELSRLGGWAMAALVSGSPAFHARLGPGWTLALSGEPLAELNMLLLGPARQPEGGLREALEVARARGLPLLALFTPHVATVLARVAEGLGMQEGGAIPLMVMAADEPIAPATACKVDRAMGPSAAGAAGDLVAAAFSLPRDAVGRVFDGAFDAASPAQVFLASRGDVPMSAVTVTRTGSTAGIWNMATPPEHQGKGVGRALLSRVMEDQRQAGVNRFYLMATAAGRPLYESLGYRTVAQMSAWVLGHSTQVSPP